MAVFESEDCVYAIDKPACGNGIVRVTWLPQAFQWLAVCEFKKCVAEAGKRGVSNT